MNLNNTVACPLDCFDACEAIYNNGKIKANKDHKTTAGKLCVNFANLLKEDYLNKAIYLQKDISLEESLNILINKLKQMKNKKTLYYKGSGNIGLLQSFPSLFFSEYGSDTHRGSLCDDIGSHGLKKSRGENVNPSISNLINSDVIICWGRNFAITSSHMYHLVKDKTFITIDPIFNKTAKISDLHLDINPKKDYELALILSKIIFENNLHDKNFMDEHDSKEFINLVYKESENISEHSLGFTFDKLDQFVNLIKNKKVSIMIGLGVQKYYEGSDIIRVIDSFAACLGLHNKNIKEGGVWYLSNSSYGFEKQIKSTFRNEISISEINYSSYDLVFIQAGDLVVSNPNSLKIINELKNTFVVYFGTTYNETCKYADLIIPSSSFLEKNDVRLSYGHEYKAISFKQINAKNTISEYDLYKILYESFFDKKVIKENDVFEYYKNTKSEKFVLNKYNFIDSLDIHDLSINMKDNEYYFITAKSKNSLNSQFKIDNKIYLHSSSNFKKDDQVLVKSIYGEYQFSVVISDKIKTKCALFYSGNRGANYLTADKSDKYAFSAAFQELVISIDIY